jgi:hypothetical protein
MFWTCLVLGVLLYVSAIVRTVVLGQGVLLGLLEGLVLGGLVVLMGRMLQLLMAVVGELVLVVVDVEDSIRRIASAQDE